jgi:curved DNA-binding protein CbpA
MEQNYYNLLGVEHDSSKDEIIRAYRILAHQYHPDKNNSSEKRFLEINKAYRVLSDDSSRKNYNKKLKEKKDNVSSSNSRIKIDSSNFYILGLILIIYLIHLLFGFWENSENKPASNDYPNELILLNDFNYYVDLGDGITNPHDFSFTQEWATVGEVLEKDEVFPVNSSQYRAHRTNGLFAVAFISVTNNGKKEKKITLSDFSFIDTEERVYQEYFDTLNPLDIISVYNNNNIPVPVISNESTLIIQPGIEEKLALIFEIAKDIDGAWVRVGVRHGK